MRATVGKWGITRDPDGSLASIFVWPWPWRYSGALLVAVAGLGFGLIIAEVEPRKEMAAWIVAGCAVFFSLCIAYELGCLSIVIALAVGAWMVTAALFPDIEFGPNTGLVLVGAFAYYAWYVGNEARRKADRLERELAALRGWVNEQTEGARFSRDDTYGTVRELERRVDKLEHDGLSWLEDDS